MTKRWMLLGGMAAAMAAVVVFCAGCEKTETGMTLTVTPATSVINANDAVLLTASLPECERVIYYPLVWSVSDSRIGFLRDAAGDSAVYEAYNAEGVNTVTVRDQSGAEGMSSVIQSKTDEVAL